MSSGGSASKKKKSSNSKGIKVYSKEKISISKAQELKIKLHHSISFNSHNNFIKLKSFQEIKTMKKLTLDKK